ncbi:MAG TPA: ATP-binding protein, partial [Dehalococcoidia bacterium]|nr:ATP-binding protein [Dehalococcoidia bacterium]
QAIQRVTDTALGSLAVDELVPQLLHRVRAALDADTSAILLLDEGGESLTARWALGLEEEVEQQIPVPLGSGFAGHVAAERRAVSVDDIDSIETISTVLRAKGVRSLLGVPLLLEDRLLGVLHVGTLQRRQFTPDDGQLLQLVADRIALALDRARLYEEARQAVRVRNEFLSAISHDLGNPVAAIRIESHQLREAAGDVINREVLEGLTQIEATASRMWRQVEEILDLARLQVGREIEMNWRVVDLVAMVRDLVSAQQATTAQHELRLQLEQPQLIGEWDATRLERVITNLLSNAVKYSPEGGEIVICLAQKSGEDAHGKWVVLQVQDRGIGIPAGDLPHIFERFYRASNVRGRFAGTGIGLAGASQIVAAHGGALTVESVEGEGTTVILRLPLDDLSEGVSE